MTMIGMDPEAVRALAGQMDNGAMQIESLMGQLTGSLEGTPWVGTDRERFVGDWQSLHCTSLRTVAQSLRDAAMLARANADQQVEVST